MVLASKFSGRPWLAQDEPWPACPLCGQLMQFFLQLNSSELPEPVGQEFGTGLLQMFYCCSSQGCEGNVETAPVSYGRAAYINKNLLIRLVEPNTEASMAPIPIPEEDYFPAKAIAHWQQLADYPQIEDLVALIYGWDHAGDYDLWDQVVERLGFADLEDYEECCSTDEGDKLAGYPRWVQGMECPGCPICHQPMGQVFQLASCQNLPYMFGDAGIGHLLQCKKHKDQLAFVWACS